MIQIRLLYHLYFAYFYHTVQIIIVINQMKKPIGQLPYFCPLLLKLGLLISLLTQKALGISLVVTLDSYFINTVATYDWKISGLTANTTNLILGFPILTKFNQTGTTEVQYWNNTVYTGTVLFSGNNLVITILPAFYANATINFKVTLVRNPLYYAADNANVIKSSSETATSFINYQMGSILGCSLSYLGVTDAAVSTAYLDFKTTNPTVSNQVVFKITYGPYTSINSKIVENGNMTCAYSINGNITFSTEVPAKNIAGKYQFDCQFPGLTLLANSTVKLRFSNARNPPYKNNYFTNPVIVETYEGGAAYDSSSSCTLTDVQVDTYKALFTQTSKLINTFYSNPAVESQLQIYKDFQSLDKIVIEHNEIQLSKLGTSIYLSRPSSIQPIIQFTVSSGTATTDIITQSSASNTNVESRKVVLTLTNFDIKVPPSASPLNFTFRFYRNYASNTSVVLEYLNIYATLQPIYDSLSIGDLAVTPTSKVIGQPTNYAFRLLISQPLSNQAYILLNLPLQVSIMNNSNAISPCIFQSIVDTTATANCTIKDAANKIVQVNVNSTNGISVNQNVTITLGLIVNPDNPEKTYYFGAETYYKQGDLLSKVELGAAIFSTIFIQRVMAISPLQPFYTVGQNPALLTLQYNPGVKIPANLNIIFTFATTISASISYKNVSVDGNTGLIYTAVQATPKITLTVSNLIAANATVLFKFEFKAPNAVTQYQALTSIEVKSTTGVIYEKYAIISISVSQPASEVFTLTPISSITGVVTNYTLNFFTNIAHTNPFFINIKFPADVTLKSTLICNCIPSSLCKGVIISSLTPGGQQIYLNITTTNMTSNTFTINLSNITNPRTINSSGQFVISTKTNYTTAGLDILSGTTTAIIAYPNAANSFLDFTKLYYRMNVQPVSIVASFYNDLLLNDFIRVRFDYRTYVLSSAGSAGVSCSAGFTCTFDSTESNLPYTTVIKVVPNDLAALAQPIKFSINGLNSSATTFAGQQFDIIIRSYSSNLRQMDEGIITYKLNCTSPASLLNKNCRTCIEPLQECTSCYSGYYLLNKVCVSDCANQSLYQTYPGSGVCLGCTNYCDKCINQTQCITCVSGAYLYENSSCMVYCNVNNGFYSTYLNNQLMCLRCWSNSCIKCLNGSSNGCIDCGTAFMDKGRCLADCDLTSNYQTANKQCIPCNERCNGCDGPTYSDCNACRPGFYNVSGVCEDKCPLYTVAKLDGTCGCGGSCSKCELMETRCVQCLNTSQYLYNFQCIGSCPESSYDYLGTCKDCNQGCSVCTLTSCVQCLSGYSVYETRCFSQCNSVGERFASVDGVCIQCPEGCDLCNGTLDCSVCLNNYTLVGTVCKKTCELQNNCVKVSPVPQKIIPVPGLISAVIWLGVVIVLKLFILKKIYMPYSYIFVGAIIEYILIIAVTAKTNATISELLKNASARLLQNISNQTPELPQPHHYASLGLLAASLAINYLSNFFYLFLFIKYLRRYIPDRQIDKISNYLVVGVGVIFNYRFSLLAYSKLFPKPNILVENQSKLTPLHYMCIASIVTSILPLSAASILIYNQYALTDLFMLGVDLLIIEVLSLFFTIWMVTIDKPEDYFQGTKKYSKQDINNTTESFNDKQDINVSKYKLSSVVGNLDNSVVHVEQINPNEEVVDEKYLRKSKGIKNVKSDNQNEPLPAIPIRASHINIQTMKVKGKQEQKDSEMDNDSVQDHRPKKIDHSFSDKKTQRNNKNKTEIKRHLGNTGTGHQANHYHEAENGIKSRNRQSPKNFSKEKRATHKKQKNSEDLNIRINQISQKAENNNESMLMEESGQSNEPSLNKARSDIVQRQKKPLKAQTQRSSGILPVTMKKKQSFGVFNSQMAESQVDEIDFESLIQTKMIDKTKDKNKVGPGSKHPQAQQQQISPSWFNEQNQRFDFQQSSDA